jgi:hypothetical protein
MQNRTFVTAFCANLDDELAKFGLSCWGSENDCGAEVARILLLYVTA